MSTPGASGRAFGCTGARPVAGCWLVVMRRSSDRRLGPQSASRGACLGGDCYPLAVNPVSGMPRSPSSSGRSGSPAHLGEESYMAKPWRPALAALTVALVTGVLTAPAGAANNKFVQTNLVSNVPGLALVTDPNLVNAWGLSASPTSPIWVSNNGTNTSTLYRGGAAGVTVVPLVVTIPGGAPTGTVFSSSSGGFVVSDGAGNSAPAVFLFDSEDGDVTGW